MIDWNAVARGRRVVVLVAAVAATALLSVGENAHSAAQEPVVAEKALVTAIRYRVQVMRDTAPISTCSVHRALQRDSIHVADLRALLPRMSVAPTQCRQAERNPERTFPIVLLDSIRLGEVRTASVFFTVRIAAGTSYREKHMLSGVRAPDGGLAMWFTDSVVVYPPTVR